ncbi:MAG: hypothetical protein ACE5KA_09165 [Nitrososphaerales archaeon]
MTGRIGTEWVVTVAIVSFAIGITVSPFVTEAFQSNPSISNDEIETLTDEIDQKIEQLSIQINETRNSIPVEDFTGTVEEEISSLQKEIKIIAAKLDRLTNLSDDVDELGKEIDDLKTSNLQSLSADLDKSEYNAGNLLTVTGFGSPDKSVNISLLDKDKVTLSQGSTLADSDGRFTFSIPLSKSLADGFYSIKIIQEDQLIETSFRIIAADVPSEQVPSSSTEGLTISTDRNEYGLGDTVMISGKTDANVFIDLDIFDSSNVQLIRTATKSDADGNYLLQYSIPSNSSLGDYEIIVTVGGKQTSVKFSVSSSTSTTPPSSTSGTLTITVDETSYNRGDFVKITGKAPANTKITITAEPPSGDTLVLTPTATDTGNYITLLSISDSASPGTWKLTAKQGIETVTTQITVI